MHDFLTAMSRGDDAERRQYERVSGNGVRVGLILPGRPIVQATIADLSRGGICLSHHCDDTPGSTVQISIAGGSLLGGRIARNGGGQLGISFRQDEGSLALIDRLLAHVNGQPSHQAA